ncbi:MAG: isoaspartyl peptidase/L-asparaginase [Prolixibacteraceae bacterium]|nr:isoaspartyl peptidase/L-asparaginase [Prolixibacteraceae bacterium]
MKYFYGFCILFLFVNFTANSQNYTLVVHGGAGSISNEMPAEMQQRYIETLDSALKIGAIILENGGTAIDAVEKVIVYFENCPLYNAGKGAVFTWDGKNELDASIMDGSNLMAGAVAGITRVKNPIKAARKVLEESPHVMLSGDGANAFASEKGLEMVDNTYFKTSKRYESFERQKSLYVKDKKGTVGCVVLDKQGNLAAGTSTGGMNLKRWGRIGDSPVIGAGTYADNNTCAVSCTGHGEYFIRLGVARDIAARMEYKQIPLENAATETIDKLTSIGGFGGIIAVDGKGNPVMKFNTTGMFRGYLKSDGTKFVGMLE